jgi:hypothetical protein
VAEPYTVYITDNDDLAAPLTLAGNRRSVEGVVAILNDPSLNELEAELTDAANLMGDARKGAKRALAAALNFINYHPQFRQRNSGYPLYALLQALEALEGGKVTPMLKPVIDGVGNRRPDSVARQMAKSYSCLYVDFLLRHADSLEGACRSVAAAWEKQGLCIGGRGAPSWKTVREWRNRFSKLSPESQQRSALDAMRRRCVAKRGRNSRQL